MSISSNIKSVVVAACLAAGSLVAAAPSAHAGGGSSASGTCVFDWGFDTNKTYSRVSNVSCTGTAKVRPYVCYYRSDVDPRVATALGVAVSTGSSTATRPSGSLATNNLGYDIL